MVISFIIVVMRGMTLEIETTPSTAAGQYKAPAQTCV